MPPKKRNSEVMAARGRLKGVLHDAAGPEDERSDSISPTTTLHGRGRPLKTIQTYSYDPNAPFLPSRGRPPKRFKKEPVEPESTMPSDQKSFIMKLFDRSVDLAKYSDNSALYPICRAWMVNQPRSNALINFKLKHPEVPELRIPQTRIMDELKSGKISDINSMPACKAVCETTLIPNDLKIDSEEAEITRFDLNYDLNNAPIKRSELLARMKTRSLAVRKHWQRNSRAHINEKFGNSSRLLKYMYKQS